MKVNIEKVSKANRATKKPRRIRESATHTSTAEVGQREQAHLTAS